VIPFWPEPSIRIGHLTVYPFGLLFLAALATGSFVLIARATSNGLSLQTTGRVLLVGLPCGIIGAHLMALVLGDRRYGLSSFGSIFGVLLFVLAYSVAQRSFCVQSRKWLDVIAYGSIFGWFLGRIGCFIAHDHLGIRTSGLLGVKFPNGSRYDLGLLETIYLGLFAAILLIFDSDIRTRRPGYLFCLVTGSYASFRFLLEFLRDTGPRYLGLTGEQYAAAVLIAISIAVYYSQPSSSVILG
jgi:phosphatidylglycerol---prolipoprotein diacylglyceryl transferase